ncbi:MAG TPA: Smr/MutS family protein [Azospirillum sp.]|nr:Smr/MutS family protein [Azospirillum sp.]
MTRRRRIVTPEERALWATAMRDAVPLPGRSLAEAMTSAPPEPPPEPVEVQPAEAPAPPPAGPARASKRSYVHVAPPPLEPGYHPNVDGRTADRLRRGKLEIDGRIDLHGMTQAQAHTALASFIHRAWHEGRRCVLVITGKGTFSAEGGVLRRSVPRWLADAPLRSMVLAVQHAQPKDGGDGALYVLIKRRRDRKDPTR